MKINLGLMRVMQVLNKKFVGRNDFLSHCCSYIVRESKQKICKVFSLYMHGRDLKTVACSQLYEDEIQIEIRW